MCISTFTGKILLITYHFIHLQTPDHHRLVIPGLWRHGDPQRQLPGQLVPLNPLQPHHVLLPCTSPAALSWCCGPGAGAHALSVSLESGVGCGGWSSIWKLKYNFYEIMHRKVRKEREADTTLSLRPSRALR